MSIIKHNSTPVTLPDPCNLGVILRVLLISNAILLLAALIRSDNWGNVPSEAAILAAGMQPILLGTLVILCAGRRWLLALPYNTAVAVILTAVLLLTSLFYHFWSVAEEGGNAGDWLRQTLLSLTLTGILLGYFNLRSRALSPAITEARLQALQSRIRPHFLFNSLNAVLSLIRGEPRRAEQALENLAELIRALMQDTRKLTPLRDEIELCKAYLAIEDLRLGERLHTDWHCDKVPQDALIPPLILQPLVENAVYHGIEPAPHGGGIVVNLYRTRDEMHCVIKNPFFPQAEHKSGNRLAVDNIKERLALHFDAEATLNTRIQQGHYMVHITWPYITSEHPTVMGRA